MTRANSNGLLLFTRHPDCSSAKTRLSESAELSRSQALQIHKALVLKSIKLLDGSAADPKVIGWSSEERQTKPISDYFGSGIVEIEQRGKDFPSRFFNTFSTLLSDYPRSNWIVIGSDVAALSAQHLAQAIDAINSGKGAIGPSTDGGFYLLGVPADYSAILPSISEVFSQSEQLDTVLNIFPAELGWLQLEILCDIDSYKDLTEYLGVSAEENDPKKIVSEFLENLSL